MSLDSAKDFRHGVEEKSILARAVQAKRYFERAQMALETVKVLTRYHPFQRGTDQLTLRVPWMWRLMFGIGRKGLIHELAVIFDTDTTSTSWEHQ